MRLKPNEDVSVLFSVRLPYVCDAVVFLTTSQGSGTQIHCTHTCKPFNNIKPYKTTPQKFPKNSQNWSHFLISISDTPVLRNGSSNCYSITLNLRRCRVRRSGATGWMLFSTGQTWRFWCRFQLCSSWTQVQAPGSWTHVCVLVLGSGVFPVPSRLPPEMLIYSMVSGVYSVFIPL